jgi:hypothetical protein
MADSKKVDGELEVPENPSKTTRVQPGIFILFLISVATTPRYSF